MPRIPYSDLKKGTFLIASPEIDKGILFRSVVLLCDHSPVGSFGMIINKPLDIDISGEMLSQQELASIEMRVRAGGPNQPNQILLLHSSEQDPNSNLQICEGVYLGGDIDSIQEMTNTPKPPSILICLGYVSWNAGLLEREFLSGIWYLHPASKKHVFETLPEKMWQTLLREMGGKYEML